VQTQGMQAFRRAWARHPMATLHTSDPGTHALLERMLLRYRGEDFRRSVAAGAQVATAIALESIEQPTLVLCGTLDVSSRRQTAAAVARSLPHAELFEVPAAGHLSNLDNPADYNASLLRFLQRHASM
jgi:3-oxoadipate enol-lactonase